MPIGDQFDKVWWDNTSVNDAIKPHYPQPKINKDIDDIYQDLVDAVRGSKGVYPYPSAEVKKLEGALAAARVEIASLKKQLEDYGGYLSERAAPDRGGRR